MKVRKPSSNTHFSKIGQQSWRELEAYGPTRIQSAKSHKRRLYNWTKRLLFALIGLSLAGAIYFLTTRQFSQPASLEAQTPSSPIEKIYYKTNGQLSARWLQSFLALAPNTEMMAVDIFALKEKLESHPQIIQADVERNFPNELRVQLSEQIPVLRLVLMDQKGRQQLKLVSESGSIFTPIGYQARDLKKLPFVRPYKSSEGKYFPIRGVARVSELLQQFNEKAPSLRAQIKVVSLEHFSGDPLVPGEVIQIQTSFIPAIILGAHQELGAQLDRLNFILKHIADRGNPSIARIDLSLRAAAAVRFKSGHLSAFD